MADSLSFDVVVVGAGPAGIAAACAAAQPGVRVGVVDDNPAAGGQIWRDGPVAPVSKHAARWLEKLRASRAILLRATRVVDQSESGTLLAAQGDLPLVLRYQKLILATGARERFLPFPGWTLPNVMGAGGLEALVRSGLPIRGKRVVVAGSGPLLFAAAAELREHGARIVCVAEQAGWGALSRFAAALAGKPLKLAQTAGLWWRLRGVPYVAGAWPVRAEGDGRLEAVVMESNGKQWEESCDYLAAGFGLVPNLELPALLGCSILNGCVQINEWQETSIAGIYCAGEPVGIGGVDLALAGGGIAGHAAAGRPEQARGLFAARARAVEFQGAMERAFALRPELRRLALPDTLVCRCEDVALSSLLTHKSWRSAKLETRCGMGPCQGRICGPATEFLLGWRTQSSRPPVFPASIRQLLGGGG